MKRVIFTAAAALLLAPLVFGQSCPEQAFLPVPAGIDPNAIAVDPASGQPLVLGVVQVVAGQVATLSGVACDPDGDRVALALWPDGPEVPLDPNGVYRMNVNCPDAGVAFVTVEAVDEYGAQRRGTWIIEVRANHPPTLCGGKP